MNFELWLQWMKSKEIRTRNWNHLSIFDISTSRLPRFLPSLFSADIVFNEQVFCRRSTHYWREKNHNFLQRRWEKLKGNVAWKLLKYHHISSEFFCPSTATTGGKVLNDLSLRTTLLYFSDVHQICSWVRALIDSKKVILHKSNFPFHFFWKCFRREIDKLEERQQKHFCFHFFLLLLL